MASSGGGNNGALSVTTSAARLVGARMTRDSVLIQNLHATNDLYVGANSNVTSANGIKVAAGQSLAFNNDYSGDLWVIASGASTDARFFEAW